MENLTENEVLLQFLEFATDDADEFALAISSDSFSSDESVFEESEHPKCRNFVDTIDLFNEEHFKSHMRLKRSTVQYLVARYEVSNAPSISNKNGAGAPKTSAKLQIYMYIWYIANTVTYRQLENLFGVARSTAWICVNDVIAWVISIAHEYIVWPTGASAEIVSQKFFKCKKIPDVIGAIDCTHININAPSKDKEAYLDRKRSYSIVLQAVVDADKKFTDIYCGEPGSLHDSRVLRRSDLFPNSSFLLADSAYPCKKWLVPAYKDYGRMTQRQKKFNTLHSSTRIVVENAFGLLKGRFRRISKFTEHKNLPAITNLVASTCVIHNICIIKDDLMNVELREDRELVTEQNHETVEEQIEDERRERLYSQAFSCTKFIVI